MMYLVAKVVKIEHLFMYAGVLSFGKGNKKKLYCINDV